MRQAIFDALRRIRFEPVRADEATVWIDGREFGRVHKIRTRIRGRECWRWTAETNAGVRLDIREHERISAARMLVSAVLQGKVPIWEVQQ